MQEKIVFYERNFKLGKNSIFNSVFYNRIFSDYRFLPLFQKRLNFHELWLIFLAKIFSTTSLFLILKINEKSSNVFIFKECFF